VLHSDGLIFEVNTALPEVQVELVKVSFGPLIQGVANVTHRLPLFTNPLIVADLFKDLVVNTLATPNTTIEAAIIILDCFIVMSFF
jgi:hypothetical protein